MNDIWMEPVKQVIPEPCVLGEGCVWDHRISSLYFVDIESHVIKCRNSRTHRVKTCQLDDYIGCVVPAEAGGIVAATGTSLVWMSQEFDWEETLLSLPFADFLRFNDGKCDPGGCLWVGTMSANQNHPGAKQGGSLYCIRDNQVLARYDGYTIPNGMAWSRDGRLFYHIDTPTRCIDVYDVEGPGLITGRRTVVHVEEGDGSPDGMCMDEEGNLWTAMWGAGKVICFDSTTGEKLHEISVPAKHVSCVTFGGEDLKTLYITTAKDGDGQGGHLYEVKLPVSGQLPYPYAGINGGKRNEA